MTMFGAVRALGATAAFIGAARAQSEPPAEGVGVSLGAGIMIAVGALLLVSCVVFMLRMQGFLQCRFSQGKRPVKVQRGSGAGVTRDETLLHAMQHDAEVETGPTVLIPIATAETLVSPGTLLRIDSMASMSSSLPTTALHSSEMLTAPKRRKGSLSLSVRNVGSPLVRSATFALEQAKAALAAGEAVEGDEESPLTPGTQASPSLSPTSNVIAPPSASPSRTSPRLNVSASPLRSRTPIRPVGRLSPCAAPLRTSSPRGASRTDLAQQIQAKDEVIERLEAALKAKDASKKVKDEEIRRLTAALDSAGGGV